jgi:hypothetical protein
LIQLLFRDPEAVVRTHQACLDLARAFGDPEGMALSLSGLAMCNAFAGDAEQAMVLAQEALDCARATSDPWLVPFCLHIVGVAFRRRGDVEQGISLFRESLAMLRPVGDRWSMTLVLVNLGGTAQAMGDTAAAWRAYQEALVLSQELWEPRGIALLLECLAEVAAAQDRAGPGARLMGAAEGLLDRTGAVWPPSYTESRQQALTAMRAALGDAAFEEALKEGRAMPLEQAIAAALEKEADG